MTLSTGVRAIDRTFDGGLPSGSLIALTSPPEAQAGPLVNAGVHVRPSLYFTTVRTEAAVRDELDRLLEEPRLQEVRNVGVDGALSEILNGLATIEHESDVIVDVLDPLEASVDQSSYVGFLNEFTDRLQATDSLGIVRCLEDGDPPRNRKLTLASADFVWQLRCQRQRDGLSYELQIPKASGIALDDDERRMDLNLGRTVSIDNSRDIA
jgi:KaiC/GvpD/RAD55 family RecA-like ATPase